MENIKLFLIIMSKIEMQQTISFLLLLDKEPGINGNPGSL